MVLPTDMTGARTWFGLVNQVALAYAISQFMQSFRYLIKYNTKFYSDASLEKVFQDSTLGTIFFNKIGLLINLLEFLFRLSTLLPPGWKDLLGSVIYAFIRFQPVSSSFWTLVYPNSTLSVRGLSLVRLQISQRPSISFF